MNLHKHVPKLKGPDQSIVIHHGDFDGIVGEMICEKWLYDVCGEDHEVHFRNSSYEKINPICSDIWKDHKEYRYIILVDICCDKEHAESAPSNVFIFDHHDTSSFIIGMNDRYFYEEKWCGAVVAWKYLYGGKPDKKLGKLLKLCDNYDMWRGNADGTAPPKESFDANTIQRKYGFKDFRERFWDGFDGYTEEEYNYIDSFWKRQKKEWKEATKVQEGKVLFVVNESQILDINFWCDQMLRKKGFHMVIVFYMGRDRLSVRVSKEGTEWIHGGYWLREVIHNDNNSKGGHAQAAGCSVEGMPIDDVVALVQNAAEVFKGEKGVHFSLHQKEESNAS